MDAGSNMSGKRQKHTASELLLAIADSLQQQMSEVISLREKVAQAENLRRVAIAMLQKKKVGDLSDERATAAALRRVRPLRNRPWLDWRGR